MAQLVLGPLLRYVSDTEATIWVETDSPCSVRVLDSSTTTFSVWGHHYALVIVSGLAPGSTTPYTVALDGEQRWPLREMSDRPTVIRTTGGRSDVRIAFGSCRAAAPHRAPYDLLPEQDARGLGIDALRAMALRLLHQAPDEWPQLMLMLGDQVYADDPSPTTARRIRNRRTARDAAPRDVVADFGEYTLLYQESWSPDVERWFLSVVPSVMIFDDHDVIDDWNISDAWVREMRAEPWWEEHIVGALVSYWIYQHLGNLSPIQIEHEGMLADLLAADDGGAYLRRWALRSEAFTPTPGGYSFNISRRVGDVNVVMFDSRNGRVLEPGARLMMDADEWEFVERASADPCRHLVLATSLPVFVPGGVHAIQQWNEVVCDGRWGRPAGWIGERLRRALDMEDWAAFDRSFRSMEELIVSVGDGDEAPASITVLGGDIHFSYATELRRRDGSPLSSTVHQLVSSPMRNVLAPSQRRVLRFGASRAGRWIAERGQRWAERPPSKLCWELDEPAVFANTIGTLEFDGDRGVGRIERAGRSEKGQAELAPAIERRLSDRSAVPSVNA